MHSNTLKIPDMKKIYFLAVVLTLFTTARSQNVGIGTNTPASKTTVNGNLSVGAGYTGTAAPANGAIIEGKVGIGTSAPDASTVLDITSGNRGVSFPNVNLQSASDAATIPTPKKGLVVYNTGVSFPPAGLYTNTGTSGTPNWQKLSDASGTISSITVTAPITSTGGANPTIGLGVVPVNLGGTGLTAIGAGQIAIGNGGNTYLNTTLTSGTGINVVSAAGSITVNNTGDTNAGDDVTTASTAGGDISGPFSNLQINSGTVGSAEIADAGIAAVDLNQMGAGNGQVLQWNGSSWAPATPTVGTVTGVTGTAPIVVTGTTAPVVSITAATGSAAGSMSAADKAKLDAATSANTASTIVMRDASGNFSAGLISANLNGQWQRIDDRTIAPADISSGYARFGFTSLANNNSAPYADFLHLRSYTDASGGYDNLVMFRKDQIGMRIYQQAWNSATPYATFKDVAFAQDVATGYIQNQISAVQTANFWITGNAGVGNTTPAARFHVSDGGIIVGTTNGGTSSNTKTLTILTNGQTQTNFGSYPGVWSPALQIQNNDNTHFVWLSPLDAANNARLRVSGSGLDIYTGGGNDVGTFSTTFTSGGNVGIGATAPTAALDVYRGSSTNLYEDGVRAHRPGSFGQYAFMSYAPSSSDAYFGSVYTGSAGVYGSIHFRQYTQGMTARDAMNINTDGYVGIATTAPTTNLDVNGTVRIRGGSPATGMVLTSTDANGNATWKDPANTGVKYAATAAAGTWYRIASNTGDRANAEFTLRDYISGGGHSTLTFRVGASFNDAGGMSFTLLNHSRYSTATFTKVRVLTATTYDPQYLEVYASRAGSVDFSISDNQQANGWVPLAWTAGSLPGGYTSREFETDNIFAVGDNDDRFTINRGGNVGVGTTTPQTNLHVSGSAASAISVSSNNYPTTYKTQLGAQSGAQGVLVFGNNSANEIRFGNTAAGGYGSVYVNNTADYNAATTGTLSMFFKSDGNVGVGNSSPVDKLDVTGHITLSGGGKEIRFRNAGGSAEQYVWHSGTSLGMGAGGAANSMFITSAGNVGVGTTAPVGKVHIFAGGAGGVGWSTGLNIGDATNYTGFIQDGGVARWRNFGTGGYDWYNSAGSAQLMILNNSGLGIGVSPGATLDVNGNARIRGGSPDANKVLTATDANGTAVWSNSIRSKQATETFTVGGSNTTFYPIVFNDAAWSDGPMELEIIRSNVHQDASWWGALQAKFRSHASSWGHGAAFINSEIYYNTRQFIARYEYNPFSTEFVVWLLGGTSYTCRANNTTRVTDYGATNKTLVNGWTANSQTTVETYVQDAGVRQQGNLNITGKFKSTGISETSDSTYKTDVAVLTNALQKVKELRGVSYNWKTEEYPDMNFEREKQIGLIAQEVEKILPEVVETDQGGLKSVEYGHIVPLLIEAVKELQNIIQSQQQQLKSITTSTENRFMELEDKIARLSRLLEPSVQK